jgi:uncharacterized protein (TIGR02001 family)
MNKKLISSLAIALAGVVSVAQAQLEDLEVSTSFGFESEYIFRGVKYAGNSFESSVDVGLYDFYAGVWTTQPTEGRAPFGHESEWNFYAGYGFEVSSLISLDVGATLYYFPETDGETTFEPYVGAAFDVFLSPAVYVYYDIDLKYWTFEASAGYSLPLGDFASLDLGGFLGTAVGDGDDDSWVYYGATADIVYSLNEATTFSIGARYSNTDRDFGAPEAIRARFWWGASVSVGF